ncbi:MAG: ASCH domain-containing protein [Planctomycetota bacterium]
MRSLCAEVAEPGDYDRRLSFDLSARRAAGSPVVLLFKRKFLDAIRCGEKTQTIRLWKHRMMREGQRSYIPGVGRIRITVVESVQFDELTDEDAVPDGFSDAGALKNELRSIYGDRLDAGYQTFRVAFERVEE